MRKFTRCLSILSLAVPLAALADPVEIVTRTSGTMTLDSEVLGWLGLTVPASVDSLPYALTVHTVFHTDAGSFDANPDIGIVTQNEGATVDVTLALGTLSYHYAGPGTGEISGYWDSYDHEVSFPLPGHPLTTVFVRNVGNLPNVNFNLNSPLYPPTLTDAPATYGFGVVSVYVNNGLPDPQVNGLVGDSPTFSVQMVPEPREAAMLAGGIMVLVMGGALRPGRRRTPA